MFNKKKKKPLNRFEDLTIIPCGHCKREIVKEDEPNGELFIRDNKPMCMVCRATKLSKFRTEIENTSEAMQEDIKNVMATRGKEEFDRVVHIAAIAQAEVEKSTEA